MDVELSTDPFYSKDNIDELERRAADVNSGKSTMKEHELIEIESSNADTLQREINSFSFYKNHLDVILGVFLWKIFRFCEQKIRIEGRSEARFLASFL